LEVAFLLELARMDVNDDVVTNIALFT